MIISYKSQVIGTLDRFVGTWKWGDTNTGLTLIMKKENGVKIFGNNDPNTTMDILLGFHKIYKNGQVAEDETMNINTNFADNQKSFVANTEEGQPNLLVVFMTHKNKNIRMKISYIDPAHIKITEVKNTEGMRVILPGKQPTDWSIDIPNNITLTKQ